MDPLAAAFLAPFTPGLPLPFPVFLVLSSNDLRIKFIFFCSSNYLKTVSSPPKLPRVVPAAAVVRTLLRAGLKMLSILDLTSLC